jgi:excisionase family DNA binding protein
MPSPLERLLSVREVARILSVSMATVYKLCSRGELANVRVLNALRIAPVAVVAFTERRSIDG